MSITMTSLRDALFVDLVNRGYFGKAKKKQSKINWINTNQSKKKLTRFICACP